MAEMWWCSATAYGSSASAAIANIVGRTIQLDHTPYLVVGIIGHNFVTDNPADLWIPYQFDVNNHDMAHYFWVSARFQPGVTVQQANEQLKLASDQFRREFPDAIGVQNRYGVDVFERAGGRRYS